ncbi:uncharacterized protein LOC142585045 isoform X2 [Dermacentor variabilis]
MTVNAPAALDTEGPSSTSMSLSSVMWKRQTLGEQEADHRYHIWTSLSVATAVSERSMHRNFTVHGLHPQHFASSVLVHMEKSSLRDRGSYVAALSPNRPTSHSEGGARHCRWVPCITTRWLWSMLIHGSGGREGDRKKEPESSPLRIHGCTCPCH